MQAGSKYRLRVPRAYNIHELKKIVCGLEETQKIDDLIQKIEFLKTTHFNEYIMLLQQLGWITKKNDILRLTCRGKIIQEISNKSDKLSDDEKSEYLKDFFSLDFVKKFMINVFEYDEKLLNNSKKCLTIPEIEEKYHSYRSIGKQASDRESRIIYNWLSALGLLESINFIDIKNNSINVCYHLVKNNISFEEFVKKIKIAYIKISNSNLQKGDLLEVEWINLPTIRRFFCSNFNVSKEVFDANFKKFVEKYPNLLQLASGSLLRKEVEREGIEINNRIIFYVRLTEGDFND